MANNIKQRELTEIETTSFENWRQTNTHIFSLFRHKLHITTGTSCHMADVADVAPIPADDHHTVAQKVVSLEVLLGYIANYAPIIARASIIKNSTALVSIWQSLRQHYGFQRICAHLLDLANIHLEASKRLEDLYQRLLAFMDDNLFKADGCITHHGEVQADEEIGLSLENSYLTVVTANQPTSTQASKTTIWNRTSV